MPRRSASTDRIPERKEAEDSTVPPVFRRQIQAFLADLVVERAISGHTKSAYESDLLTFAGYCVPLGILDPGQVVSGTLVEFLAHRNEASDAPRTRARRAACLRSFFRWRVTTGRSETNPSLLLPSPRLPSLLPKALPGPTMRALLSSSGDSGSPTDLRDRLLIVLLYGSGLRASEVAALSLSDIDLEAGFVRVLGKGRKERRVPISGSIPEDLKAYLAKGRPKVAKASSPSVLLLGDRGGALGRDGVYRAIKRRLASAGAPTHASPHTLRHTFATDLVRGGADLRAVQEMLGHASIDTTQIYTALANEHLKAAHRRHHPRA